MRGVAIRIEGGTTRIGPVLHEHYPVRADVVGELVRIEQEGFFVHLTGNQARELIKQLSEALNG